MNWRRLLPWPRADGTTGDEARAQLDKLEQRDDEVRRLGRELREHRRRNNFSGMVQQAITRTVREGP